MAVSCWAAWLDADATVSMVPWLDVSSLSASSHSHSTSTTFPQVLHVFLFCHWFDPLRVVNTCGHWLRIIFLV